MKKLLGGLLATLLATSPSSAAITLFQSYVGSYGLSTSGGGSTGSGYNVSAFVPFGATVTAAYLYQATNFTNSVQSITMNGNAVTFGPRIANGTACCQLASARADVTSLVAGVINGGAGGTYNFAISEGNSSVTDGTALAVVYSLASLPESTVALLDGFASVTGDTTTLNFANPLDPTASGFIADMRLGIGFSFPPQSSTVTVNGTRITNNAGGFDDGQGADGGLITVGGDNDPFSTLLPTYDNDHERYNLTPYVKVGDTSITIATANASQDDNIFLAAFRVSGRAGVNAPPPPPSGVPEPGTWAMMLVGFGGMGAAMRRRRHSKVLPSVA